MTITSTKCGSKKIESKSVNYWWKNDDWRTERGSDVEVATLIVITVVLRASVPGKQVHYYPSDAFS
jgi:hypothetical protein